LLHEAGGRPIGNPVRYAVPEPTDPDLFQFDVRMFTIGWVNVLEDSELAFLCMVADLQARNGSSDPVPVFGEERVGYYGLGTDGYQAHQLLERAGLLTVRRAAVRRTDGTFQAHPQGLADIVGAPHSFGIVRDGFGQLALPTVVSALLQLRTSGTRD